VLVETMEEGETLEEVETLEEEVSMAVAWDNWVEEVQDLVVLVMEA